MFLFFNNMPYIFVKVLKRLSCVFNRLTYTLIRIFSQVLREQWLEKGQHKIQGRRQPCSCLVLLPSTHGVDQKCAELEMLTGSVSKRQDRCAERKGTDSCFLRPKIG